MFGASILKEVVRHVPTVILAVAIVVVVSIACGALLRSIDPSYNDSPLMNFLAVFLIIGFLTPILLCLVPAVLITCAIISYYDWLTEPQDNPENIRTGSSGQINLRPSQ